MRSKMKTFPIFSVECRKASKTETSTVNLTQESTFNTRPQDECQRFDLRQLFTAGLKASTSLHSSTLTHGLFSQDRTKLEVQLSTSLLRAVALLDPCHIGRETMKVQVTNSSLQKQDIFINKNKSHARSKGRMH